MHLSPVGYSSVSKISSLSCGTILSSLYHYHSSNSDDKVIEMEYSSNTKKQSFIGSPARVQKLIASQKDPLLAKEIFDLALRQPDFQLSYSAYHTLILKLGRSHHFSIMDTVLSSLKRQNSSISPSLFSHIIQIYGDAKLPEKAMKTFYTILEFNMKPLRKHLNSILEILVSNRQFLRPAFDLFRAAHRYGVYPNTKSYNILMRAFCLNGDLSIAYSLFNQMLKRDVLPDVESHRILMQGLCRKSQVNKAVDLLGDMLNKGYVPDTFSYTTVLNSLCRKMKLKEAYKLLCRMKMKGCNPDVVHYNTVISGCCKAGHASEACKVLEDMSLNGCSPNLLSYQNIVGGLCNQGMYDEANTYFKVMMSKGFSPHFSVVHLITRGYCNIGRVDDASEVLFEFLKHGYCPHLDTWAEVLPRICQTDGIECTESTLKRILAVEINPSTRIVDAGVHLEEYLIKKVKRSAAQPAKR